MAGLGHVPKFGNWETGNDVPFTVVFDNARAGKAGNKIINPNDPAQNPSVNSSHMGLEPVGTRPQNAVMEQGSPIRRHPVDARRPGDREQFGGEPGPRENRGADLSPSHPGLYQGRRPGSPYWERKNPPADGNTFAPGTPGKSRTRSRPDETSDRSPTLPKFGAWDEKDPSSAEGFTEIFNMALNEKRAGGHVRTPALQGETPVHQKSSQRFSNGSKKKSSMWTCCFGSSTLD